jgi:hypothetical protein
VSETTVVCSQVVCDWLYSIDQIRKHQIYAGFEMKELIKITRLPLKKVEEFCESLTYSFTKNLSFNSATLKDQTFCFINELDKLNNRDEQDKITRALFECKDMQG